MTRGYSAIALHNPKTPANIGAAMRAAGCYGADLIIVSGKRYNLRSLATDTQKAWKNIPTIKVDDVFDGMPDGAIPVAVDLLDGATSLFNYVHPERAFYIFGPEDGTLDAAITSRCRDKIMVQTAYCMNLAATVNVVLYDRAAKASKKHTGPSPPPVVKNLWKWRNRHERYAVDAGECVSDCRYFKGECVVKVALRDWDGWRENNKTADLIEFAQAMVDRALAAQDPDAEARRLYGISTEAGRAVGVRIIAWDSSNNKVGREIYRALAEEWKKRG